MFIFVKKEMSLLTKEIIIHVDSAYGDNLSELGSSFTLNMSPPLRVPEDAIDATVSVDQATLQYTFPNLSVGSTTDYFEYTTVDGSNFRHAIPEGIYGLSDVVDYMNREASADGVNVGLTQQLFSAVGIDATQRVALGVWHEDSSASLVINMSQTPALASLLGFQSDASGDLTYAASATTAGTYEYKIAPNVATFSALSYLRIESSLPIKGVDPRGQSSSTLAVVVPDVSPGSQILFRPLHLSRHAAPGLIGAETGSIQFSLKDNNGNDVSTLGESWSLVLRVGYTVRV